ncbi:MAG TPA: ABC transporter permease, partial [Thermomicrobiales bacterium]|nr:ABC transporter permease [Thermomicrobiales bacterium]
TYGRDRRRSWFRLMLASPAALASCAFIAIVALAAIFSPLIVPYDPRFIDPAIRLLPPSLAHLLGTDELGRDIFSRLIEGGRVSLLVGAAVTFVSATVGTLLGVVAGFYRRVDPVIMRVMDGFMAFPGILLAIAVVISLGPRTSSIILALSLVYIPTVARLMRSTTLVIRELPYIESARSIGQTDLRILWRYVLANSVSPLIVQCTFIAAYAILAEASLSFLGAGGDPEAPSWGNMLRDGQRLLGPAWWIAVAPGTMLFLTVLALNLIGDALRDALDPRTRERREDGVAGMK